MVRTMTTVYTEQVRCAICGEETECTGIGSTNALGSPDLDTRPPEMERSTIHAWVQRCPRCGYCASNLGQGESHIGDLLEKPEYVAQLREPDSPALANSFLCKAMIDDYNKEWANATWALIHAAWACDDASHSRQAQKCRERAVGMLGKAEESGQSLTDQGDTDTAILVDLMRRSDHLAEAKEVIQSRGHPSRETVIRKIMYYQILLIERGDLQSHTIAEALHGEQDRAASNTGTLDSDTACTTGKRWWQVWK